MKTSNRGIELIKRFEGFRADAYKCPAGIWTIGYGTTLGVSEGMHVSEEEATGFLLRDVRTYEDTINGKNTAPLTQNQFDALVCFAYNLGSRALLTSTLWKYVQLDHNDKRIAGEFQKWVYASGRKLKGLVTRRKAEADLYFDLWSCMNY